MRSISSYHVSILWPNVITRNWRLFDKCPSRYLILHFFVSNNNIKKLFLNEWLHNYIENSWKYYENIVHNFSSIWLK